MVGMRVDVSVCKGVRLFLGPHGVKTEAVRPQTFAECSKGRCICLHAPPTPHIPHPLQLLVLIKHRFHVPTCRVNV
jgi:hypothetical protein